MASLCTVVRNCRDKIYPKDVVGDTRSQTPDRIRQNEHRVDFRRTRIDTRRLARTWKPILYGTAVRTLDQFAVILALDLECFRSSHIKAETLDRGPVHQQLSRR